MLIPIQNLKLEEEKKKRLRNLDPRKTHCHPVPKKGEGEGNQEQQQENQIQNFILQHIHHRQQQSQPQPPPKKTSRLLGQIVPVHGGHIVRSTGQKDRHSKVHTAKGLRDRRIRLSAHTAIQFYDIQDRLGYDRPSKAVDWLMKNAKAAIDQLDELTSWQPYDSTDFQGKQAAVDEPVSTSAAILLTNPSSDPPAGLLSRASSHAQDLRLSLQSFQDATDDVFLGSAANLPLDSNSLMNPWNVADNMFGQDQFFTQREPLQSSNLSSMRTWSDQVDNASPNHQMHHSLFHLSPSVPYIGFGSSSVDFSGFRLPMRIQNKEEHDGDISDKQNSASVTHY